MPRPQGFKEHPKTTYAFTGLGGFLLSEKSISVHGGPDLRRTGHIILPRPQGFLPLSKITTLMLAPKSPFWNVVLEHLVSSTSRKARLSWIVAWAGKGMAPLPYCFSSSYFMCPILYSNSANVEDL
ncbi:MAG: hypothetical protein ACR65R_18710 [Methylomicrobium sp.]